MKIKDICWEDNNLHVILDNGKHMVYYGAKIISWEFTSE